MTNLKKYLKNYAETEVELLSTFPRHCQFTHTLIVPAYKEDSTFIDSFIQSTLVEENVLLIIVINQPESEQTKELQQQLYDAAFSKGNVVWQCENLSLIEMTNGNSSMLIVDRFNRPIEDKLGVGLARKIGADLACYLINEKCITTHWLHSSDADAQLPSNYFSSLTTAESKSSVAACYNFTHRSDNKVIEQANDIYEQSLRYYVSGLTYANSHYNFFTIGSVLAFKADAYACVRGFPKRSAGEDFYLLNKLAKLGDILWLKSCVLALEARMSDRVPFGTGPAVKSIVELSSQGKVYYYYNPEVFESLKIVLTNFNKLNEQRKDLELWYGNFTAEIKEALISIGFESFVAKQQSAKQEQFDKQLIVWFDAFKTLKFIHFLRDNYYQNLPLSEAVLLANFDIE